MELPLSREEILRAAQGRLVNAREDENHFVVPSQICTDTRQLRPGQLFLALTGPRYDGNNFLEEAHKRGACGAIATRFPLPLFNGFFVIQVSDTLQALHAIASSHRSKITAPVIAVTGSNGKTTVKGLIGQMLRKHFSTYTAPGNLNNQIGVPLSLLQVASHHRAVVLELGTSEPGEIGRLSQLVKPCIGVITNVHRTHLAGLGTVREVAREKAALIHTLNADKKNVIVLNADDEWYGYLRQQSRCRVLSFGLTPEADVTAASIQPHFSGLSFDVRLPGHKPLSVQFPYPGLFHVHNVLAAVTACIALNVDPALAVSALHTYKAPPLRYNIQICGPCQILEDCYNANPDSVKSALRSLGVMGSTRKIAVLGDMGELGAAAVSLHEDVGCFAASIGIDAIFACGEFAPHVIAGARMGGLKNAFAFTTKEEMVDKLAVFLAGGELLLLKGSRMTKMEEVLVMLRERFE